MLDKLARRSFANPTTLILAIAIIMTTVVVLPATADDGAAGKSIDKPLPAECALLDDLDKRALMDGLLLKLAIMCDRTDLLGQVRQEPNMEVGLPDAGHRRAGERPRGRHRRRAPPRARPRWRSARPPAPSARASTTPTTAWCRDRATPGSAGRPTAAPPSPTGGARTRAATATRAMVWRKSDGNFYFATLHSSGLGIYRSTDDCQTFQQARDHPQRRLRTTRS